MTCPTTPNVPNSYMCPGAYVLPVKKEIFDVEFTVKGARVPQRRLIAARDYSELREIMANYSARDFAARSVLSGVFA